MKETSLGVWHGPCSRGSSKHGPMPHENKSRTGTPGRARQGPQSGQSACMMCVCTFRAVWGAHRCPACSSVAGRPAALPPCRPDRSTPPCPIPRPKPVATEIRFVQKHGSVYPAVVVRNSEGRFWSAFRRSVGTLVGPSQGLSNANRLTLRLVVKSNRIESSRLKILQYLARLHGGTLHRPRANLWRFGIPPPLSLSRKGRGWVCGSWLRLCDISPRIFGCARHG